MLSGRHGNGRLGFFFAEVPNPLDVLDVLDVWMSGCLDVVTSDAAVTI